MGVGMTNEEKPIWYIPRTEDLRQHRPVVHDGGYAHGCAVCEAEGRKPPAAPSTLTLCDTVAGFKILEFMDEPDTGLARIENERGRVTVVPVVLLELADRVRRALCVETAANECTESRHTRIVRILRGHANEGQG